MKKKFFKGKINSNNVVGFVLVVCIMFMSIGWSVFSENLMIDNITAVVRLTKDIRVTGASASNFTNQAMIDWVDYNVKSLQSSIQLPRIDSTVTFKVKITNIGSKEMGIYNITGLPDNLEYELVDYHLKDKLCNNDLCSLGMEKYITITLKYKSSSPVVSGSQVIKLDFDFRPFHKVTYVDFDEGYTSSYPQEIIDGDTFRMTLKEPYPVGAKPFIGGVGVTYHYEGDTLVVENITEDLEIKTNYIQNIEDLVSFSNHVNNGNNYSGKTVILERSLDFQSNDSYRNPNRFDFHDYNGDLTEEALILELQKGRGFLPIGVVDETTGGDRTFHFAGNFDGQEHTISNLYINNNVRTQPTGFFGAIEDATIKNFTLEGKVTSSEYASIGGIVALGKDSVIDNVTNKADVSIEIGRYQTAGIIANAGGMTISNCKNYGNISNGNHTGGIAAIVGNGIDKTETTITNSYNYGTISNYLGSTATGGIVGHQVDKDVGLLTIDGCENYGTISVDKNETVEQKVGGIIGIVRSNAIISNSVNKGQIVGHLSNTTFNLNAGGIIGRVNGGNAIVRNCHNIGNITGEYRLGGIVGHINTGGTAYVIDSHNEGTLGDRLTNKNNNSASGGIIGYGNNIHVFIINSHNIGEIHGYQAGGIIGAYDTTAVDSAFVINTYNAGEITSNDNYAGGLFGHLNQADLRVDNVYNIGIVSGPSSAYTYGIGYINTTSSHLVARAYYSNEYTGSNQDYGWLPLDSTSIRSSSFMDTLNNNISLIDVSEMKNKLVSLGLVDTNYDIHVHHWGFDSNLNYPVILKEH